MSQTDLPVEEPDFAFEPLEEESGFVSKLAAIFAVMAFVVAMSWGGNLAAQMMPVSFNQAFGQVLMGLGYPAGDAEAADPDFTFVSLRMVELFAYQYGAVALAVAVLGMIRGSMRTERLGLWTGRRSFGQLLQVGLVSGCVVSLATGVFFVAKEYLPLGDDTVFWWTMKRVDWDADFWLFMAVGSFALVPVVEELTYRSAMLGRLTRSFSPGAALIGIAIVFSVMHSQYWSLGVAGYIALANVVFSGAVFGYTFLRTGSVIPAIIAHAMVNLPITLEFEAVRITLCLIAIVMARKPIAKAIGRIFKALWHPDSLVLAAISMFIIAGIWAAISTLGLERIWIEAGVLVLAVGLAVICRLLDRPGRLAG